ncbi:KpsF/GutQ family protein [Acidipropionibacterium acidipropionici ATCC 4875]|uniref:KpsF/GutQ family protein n=1 Tax=Acidipropionibacterium acidipropionici (strain ATCC 4875 / DSM 20272 / JCM 6432 / NBRC 12425 / NCIMB 8070 / 4) TaxID=1171373 RepID=K7S879_ACIA4|nr:SIS domain-containing protein [Acidipropionibacterium acidipropionici]AFV90782.1 KpsF/GutQ family protein [Acidipropionibacterium acidipropionici ATCC 4875]ALN15066.1 hypothetical protein ASQ49_07065 [Acidipropionibacterium acidipropionici]APZ09183.1 hypothetical protein BWX38_07865 [Acidipropionibacterium acidipropionici]MDN6555181.1 SIS domain-containing protein [Acidipropionibacterium acidipropionici]
MLTRPDLQRLPGALEASRTSVELESRALEGLWERNERPLRDAVAAIAGITGRLAVCGLGKSGHIGTKIAASMASMGIPTFFLHAAEALHGDFGMCTGEDAGILISYSGATEEVVKVAGMMRLIGMPVITMTGDPASPLARLGCANLDISVDRESDPLNLAPTSSGVTTLVLGDALAVALQGLLDFTEEDFGLRHPGGALGRRVLAERGLGHA